MYAFKTERPDAARRYHNKFVTGTNYQEESNRRFALSEPTENILRTSILESGWLIKNITLRDVNAVSGNAVNIGASELYTGRVDGGRFHKKMAINGTEFFLTETDTCARISYSDMSHIYHTGVPDEFEKTVESFLPRHMRWTCCGSVSTVCRLQILQTRKSIKKARMSILAGMHWRKPTGTESKSSLSLSLWERLAPGKY